MKENQKRVFKSSNKTVKQYKRVGSYLGSSLIIKQSNKSFFSRLFLMVQFVLLSRFNLVMRRTHHPP